MIRYVLYNPKTDLYIYVDHTTGPMSSSGYPLDAQLDDATLWYSQQTAEHYSVMFKDRGYKIRRVTLVAEDL